MQINPDAIQTLIAFNNLDCLTNPNYEEEYKLLRRNLGRFDQEDIKKLKEVLCSVYPSIKDKDDLIKRKLGSFWTCRHDVGGSIWHFFNQLHNTCCRLEGNRSHTFISGLNETIPEFRMASIIYGFWVTIEEVKDLTIEYKSALNYIGTEPTLDDIKGRYLSDGNVEGELFSLFKYGRFNNKDWLWMEGE